MIKVIGVRFRTAGKIYFFDPLDFEIQKGDHVIVETARGIEFGTVVAGIKEVEEDKVVQPLKPVIRIATEWDCEQEAANKVKEKEAFKICLEKIRQHELEMKLIDAEYTFDNNKVLFYFTADGRIDFRELVKDLASVFKTRIELRQIGVRDETKILGGIGICGRPLCCHSYLSDFIPVSIKMAKEQNLSLNPTKISGVCGRLMCCLKNEEETYEELNRRLPGIGDYVTTEDGLKGEVQSVNVLRQLVKVVVENNDEKEIREYEVDKLTFKRKHGKKEKVELSKEELEELERLEKQDRQEGIQEAEERKAEKKPERQQENSQEGRQDRRGEQRQNHRFHNRNEHYNRNGREERPGRHENGADGALAQESQQEERQSRQDNSSEERQNRTENHQEERQSRQEYRREERRNRYENRQEERRNRYENRQEERGNRYENRQEERGNRYENRQEERGNRYENRQEERGNRYENRKEERGNRYENRQEERGNRYENRQEGRRDRRYDNRQNRHDRRPRREHQEDMTGRNAQNHDNNSQG